MLGCNFVNGGYLERHDGWVVPERSAGDLVGVHREGRRDRMEHKKWVAGRGWNGRTHVN